MSYYLKINVPYDINDDNVYNAFNDFILENNWVFS